VSGPLTGLFIKGESIHWEGFLLSGPVVWVLGFLAVFWAARGFKAILFLKRYNPGAVPAAVHEVESERALAA